MCIRDRAASLLKRNILIYGVGGLIAPFIGIKLIDMAVTALHLSRIHICGATGRTGSPPYSGWDPSLWT